MPANTPRSNRSATPTRRTAQPGASRTKRAAGNAEAPRRERPASTTRRTATTRAAAPTRTSATARPTATTRTSTTARPTATTRSGAPTRTRSTVPARSGATVRARGQRPQRNIVLIALALIACFCVVLGIWLVVTNSGHAPAERSDTTRLSAGQTLTTAENPAGAAVPKSSKLEGASESVDGNGIVHGTTADGVDYVLYGRGQTGASADKVTFAAVGDVFATNMNFPILAEYGTRSGLDYDFEPYYQGVKDEIGTYDLRFINQETPCAGTDDGYEYSGYPVFNTPDSSIHALANVGFNIANFNSNHTWDMGSYGIERSHSLFAEHPGVMVIGSYASQEDRDTVHLVECNGATVALLSYSYGDNMYGDDAEDFPNKYYTCQFDKSVMTTEIERAKSVADAVVVYMHWGTEYDTSPNDNQLEYAQFLADLDVDAVIGSHAHIMQPIRMYTSASGKQVPVVFGLSDFITGWTITDTILSGMFSCDFVWKDGALSVDNCSFTPAIEWSDGGDTYVRFLKDMSDAEIAANTRTEDVSDDVTYLHDFIDGLKMEVPVNW